MICPFTSAAKLFFLPPLRTLGHLLTNPSRPIRTKALAHLQRTLPGSSQLSPPDAATLSLVFDAVLFPTLDELLKPQVFMLDPAGMEETRLRACALVCRVFLVYLGEQGEKGGDGRLMELWLGVVDVLDRLMNSGKPDQLVRPATATSFSLPQTSNFKIDPLVFHQLLNEQYEAVPESLKNLLLVLHSSNILLPPTGETPDSRSEAEQAFWSTTYERLERFLPTFLDGLFVPPAPPVEAQAPEVGVVGGEVEKVEEGELA